jgi:ATP-binding cassette subfamily C protein LapB
MTSKSAKKARSLSQLAMFLTSLTTQLTTIAVVIVGVFLIFDGELTVGALIACTILTGRAMAPLSQVAGILTRFNQSMVSLRTLDNVMNMPIERPAGKQFVHRPNLRGAIEFRDVSFTYPNQEILAVENASFAIKPGERVGVIGKIGSGKSTIEKLILGLYEPSQGSIRIDGTDIKQVDPADLRRNIGYVAQDIFLFFGSVKDNIAMGAPYVDDAAILRAARISGVDSFISKHPHGFDLQVGERGENLSGGQRQSIAIARALVRDPSILILDEPTSAMDKGSEDWFISRLKETMEGRTLIVVTQRVSLLTLVDRLIVIDGGKVVADGPRDSVIETLARGQIRGAID